VALRLGHVGIYTPAIVILYLVAVRAIYVHERKEAAKTSETADAYANITLRQAVVRYAAAAALVVAGGVAMPFAAVRLATAMGWGQSFVGTLLVAGATSLPEAASTNGALKVRAIDLAIGNLFGSNLFNILILAIDDIAYLKGRCFGISPVARRDRRLGHRHDGCGGGRPLLSAGRPGLQDRRLGEPGHRAHLRAQRARPLSERALTGAPSPPPGRVLPADCGVRRASDGRGISSRRRGDAARGAVF
jgi:hypothetical protein